MREPILLPNDLILMPAPESLRCAAAQRARLYRGIQVAVARELSVTEGHVSLVVRGKRTSERVLRALAAAVARLEQEAA